MSILLLPCLSFLVSAIQLTILQHTLYCSLLLVQFTLACLTVAENQHHQRVWDRELWLSLGGAVRRRKGNPTEQVVIIKVDLLAISLGGVDG